MTTGKLLVSSIDCELLLQLRTYHTLSGMAEGLSMDKSYLSKRLAKIALESSVLEKVNGKWSLNSKGIDLVSWYEQAIQDQQGILKNTETITIATTQLISERVMTALIPKLKENFKVKKIVLTSSIHDLEEALLLDKINFVITCGIPVNPEIRYKKIFKSPLAIVLPYIWKDSNESVIDLLKFRPYVSHSGMNLRNILSIDEAVPNPSILYDHLSGVREAVVQGLGWSILPMYAVEREIERKNLKVFKILTNKEEFQLWWHPKRVSKNISSAFVDMLLF